MVKTLNLFFTKLTHCPDFGKLVLRLTIGILMILHGIAKVKTGGLGYVESLLAKEGLPTFIAYGVYISEIIAPVLIILGILTRPAALIVVFNMLVAVGLSGSYKKMYTLTPHGGWAMELDAFFVFGAIAILFLGAGKFALAKSDYR